jgi:predicted nucleic acid-binding protein
MRYDIHRANNCQDRGLAFEISDIPELHDRIIAATAIHRNAPLITNDPVIAASKFLKTLW